MDFSKFEKIFYMFYNNHNEQLKGKEKKVCGYKRN